MLFILLLNTCAAFTLNLTQSYQSYGGIYKSWFLVNNQLPGPLLEVDENDLVSVTVNNFLPVSVTIHFHGILQLGSPWADGVPGITQLPIPPNGSFTHVFTVANQSGPAWYHAHFKGYASDGIYGPIYIRPKDKPRPYGLVARNSGELSMLYELEKSPVNIIADDLFDDTSDGFYSRMLSHHVEPICTRGILVNGMGRINCPDYSDFNSTNSWGCSTDDTEDLGLMHECTPTFGDLYTMSTQNRALQYLNVINAGGQYVKAFSIENHSVTVIAVDGVFVVPKEACVVEIPPGSRVTLIVRTEKSGHHRMNFAAIRCTQKMVGYGIMRYGTDTDDTDVESPPLISELYSPKSTIKLHSLVPYTEKLKNKGPADHTFRLYMNRTGAITFSMFKNGALLPLEHELAPPVLYEGLAENLSNITLQDNIEPGDVVDIVLDNFRKYHHPIHLHGHIFHVVDFSESKNFAYDSIGHALDSGVSIDFDNAPCFDSILVPPGGHAVIRFVANNPGVWLLHCHNLSHMLGGMGAIIFEAIEKIPWPRVS